VIDVAGGHTQAIMATVSTLAAHIHSGKVRGLAVTGKERIPILSDLPTFAEAGVPNYDTGNWIGLSAPAGTPEPIIAKLHKEIAEIQKLPDVKKQLDAHGSTAQAMSTAEFAAYINQETERWASVIKAKGIKPQ
jgi:tripartite-type tricarboxylate transporter receptor subunit TctC